MFSHTESKNMLWNLNAILENVKFRLAPTLSNCKCTRLLESILAMAEVCGAAQRSRGMAEEVDMIAYDE
jgi:hypothetical protein